MAAKTRNSRATPPEIAPEAIRYVAGPITFVYAPTQLSFRVETDSSVFQGNNIFGPAVGDRDDLDLRQNASSPNLFPPEFYVTYLRQPDVVSRIGAQARYQECPNAPFIPFARTGDDARTLLPQLSALANSRLKILIWVNAFLFA